MADYYPLLAKAVAGLPNASLDARRAIYERARKALYGQLRSLEPPVPESVVEAEARDLEAAVARLEAEIASRAEPGEGSTAVEDQPQAGSVAGDAQATGTPQHNDPVEEPLPGGGTPDGDVVPERAEEPAEAPREARLAEAAGTGSNLEALVPEVPDAGLGESEEPGPHAPIPPRPAARTRPEAQRPVAPQRAAAAAPARRLWIVGAAVGLVVILVAIAAYLLRDRPEDIMARQAAAPPPGPETGSGAKIVDRIGSGETAPPAPPIAARRVETVKSRVEPVMPPAAVARRAALLIEAPDEQAKVRTLLGTVVWRLDNVSHGPGEPLSMAVRAEIDIPEEKLQAAMMLQKNFDTTLPASHTLKLRFSVPPESALGGVKQISVPQMRREDTATGEALSGVPVPVMENSFLVGLARGPAEAANVDLLRSREWIDVPMLLANGRIAKLTFEKGTSGQTALEDALTSWQGQ